MSKNILGMVQPWKTTQKYPDYTTTSYSTLGLFLVHETERIGIQELYLSWLTIVPRNYIRRIAVVKVEELKMPHSTPILPYLHVTFVSTKRYCSEIVLLPVPLLLQSLSRMMHCSLQSNPFSLRDSTSPVVFPVNDPDI